MKSSAVGHLRRKSTMKTACTAFVLLIQVLNCLASDDSPFQLTNRATGFCLVKFYSHCFDLRWTTGDRLLVPFKRKCLGVQGKSVGSEVSLYDCDENSELQKWECRNETVLALKDQELYIELTADNTAALSRTIEPNNHLTISGTTSGACSRTYRELYTIDGNAHGRSCMFPFYYKNQWYTGCTSTDSPDNRAWCAIETKYENELWGYCPTNNKDNWKKHSTTGDKYQLNTKSALTWSEAEASCKQQSASLLSITSPEQQAFVTVLLENDGRGQGDKFWTGMVNNQEHGWHWSNQQPYRYLNWDSGYPLANPGENCAIVDGAVQFSWQSSTCGKRLGYICYSKSGTARPTPAPEAGFCPRDWTPRNGHCFYLNRVKKTWSDAQTECRKEGGDLVSIHNVEEQGFVVSQLGYGTTDEVWIGLNDIRTERLYDWSDHSAVTFTSWEVGNPAVFSDHKDCVLIRGQNGNWADRVCDERHEFICMKKSTSGSSGGEVEQDLGCKTGWKRHGSYCYFVGTETKTFDEAKEGCKSSNSYLADISNGVDNAFLVSLVGMRPEKYFWLGLSNQKDIYEFEWTNSASVRFTHWNTDMPGHRQGCVAMMTGTLAGLWDVLPCTNRTKYICKHLAEGAVVTPVPPTPPPPTCADGWTRTPTRNFCYKLFPGSGSGKKTWYEARDYCRAIGGDLLSIHSVRQPVDDWYRYFGLERVWIGLSAPDPTTGFVWSDGSPVNIQNWDTGEPNNRNNVESCTELKLHRLTQHHGVWNDVHCEKYNKWMCQIRAGKTPKPPPDPVTPDYNVTSGGWLEWKGNQYYINKNLMTMEEARDICKQRHGDLVTINSEAEAVFLWKRISQDLGNYWIGLTVDLDRTFQWMDGSPVIFQRWDKNQPDMKNYDQKCVMMESYNGFWHDYNCGQEVRSICKHSGSPPVNATVAPKEEPKGGCPPNWQKFNSKCYLIVNNKKLSWNESRDECKSSNGNLASIASRHVQVFLMTQMATKDAPDLWIGLYYPGNAPVHWTDGHKKSYINLGDIKSHPVSRVECFVINRRSPIAIGKWLSMSCNVTNGYVCMKDVDPNFHDNPEPKTPTEYVRIFNDSIKVVTKNMTWDEAKKHCEGDGATLTSIHNEWTQAYVELLAAKAPVWIGLNKMQTNQYFRFINGWHMSFTRWGMNEPSRDRPCVYVDANGRWKTAHCNQTMNSACLKSTDVPPTESSVYPGVCPQDPTQRKERNSWLPFRGYCYWFSTDDQRWSDAAVSCKKHGGMIASIEDPDEQQFIQNNINFYHEYKQYFWIGLFKNHNGEYLWLDKTVMDYTNWAENQPNHIYGDSGQIRAKDGAWRVYHSYQQKPYICKTPKVLPTQSPTSPITVPVVPVHRSHIILAALLCITGLTIGVFIALFLFKKSGRQSAINTNLSAFDNPMFFKNELSEPDLVDTTKLVVNAEEESPESLI